MCSRILLTISVRSHLSYKAPNPNFLLFLDPTIEHFVNALHILPYNVINESHKFVRFFWKCRTVKKKISLNHRYRGYTYRGRGLTVQTTYPSYHNAFMYYFLNVSRDTKTSNHILRPRSLVNIIAGEFFRPRFPLAGQIAVRRVPGTFFPPLIQHRSCQRSPERDERPALSIVKISHTNWMFN